jgi:hypothetical protein
MAKTVRFHQIGGPEVLIEEAPSREPGKGEAKLLVQAIGLNRAESRFMHGYYLEPTQLPASLGYEAAGAASLIEPASNPKVEHKSRGFLRELNSGGATPLEQLSPKEARDLLAALQASAPHNGASRGTGSNSSFVRIVPLQPLKLRHGQYLPLRQ